MNEYIKLADLIEAVRNSMCHPYGQDPVLDVSEFLSELYSIQADQFKQEK